MTIAQLFAKPPGSRILLNCPKDDLEEIICGINASIPDGFPERTVLNSCPMVSMEITGDEDPNSFRDLAALCGRLIAAAGRKSHFCGLVLLNISGLLKHPEDRHRLKALGEVMAIRDGLASKCVTVFYGVSTENECLTAADCLDFDGRLDVEQVRSRHWHASLRVMLGKAGMTCATDEAARLLKAALREVEGDKGFDAVRFLHSCGAGNDIITEDSLRSALEDPYSYMNRFNRTRTGKPDRCPGSRRIGFGSVE